VPSGHLCQTCLMAYFVSESVFPHQAPTGHRCSDPPDSAPGGQPVPAPAPRWARCPVDQRLHLLAPAQAVAVDIGGHGRIPESPRRAVELATARLVLRKVIALADEAPALADDQLRVRLVDLARVAWPGQRPAYRPARPPHTSPPVPTGWCSGVGRRMLSVLLPASHLFLRHPDWRAPGGGAAR
jgi:hypothetical protein